jgi:hypothetical protein
MSDRSSKTMALRQNFRQFSVKFLYTTLEPLLSSMIKSFDKNHYKKGA